MLDSEMKGSILINSYLVFECDNKYELVLQFRKNKFLSFFGYFWENSIRGISMTKDECNTFANTIKEFEGQKITMVINNNRQNVCFLSNGKTITLNSN
jgi:23S rRNA pseudoU1915 N3-methylase RlmH